MYKMNRIIRLTYNELISNNVYVDSIKNNDGVKFLNKTESIKKYFTGETILPYDWAPDYENSFSIFDSTGYTAQCNGWMSIDRTEVSPSSIFINGNITNTFSNNGSVQLFLSKGDIVTASSLFDFTFSPSISDSNIPFDFNSTPFDIWSAVPVKNEDGLTLLKNLHIPNASTWNIKVREPNNLIITKILDNKAYNGDTFVCNIQFEKIKFASNLFSYCDTLTSFDSELSSLEDAPGMFFNCNLDSQSVEKILSSIPTYTTGEHTLTLTIQESAKEKFQEITGQTIELGNFYDISYKGWKINIFIKDNRLTQTPYDIYKNAISLKDNGSILIKNLYIPDASAWNKEIYQQYELTITSVNSDKAYNGDNFVCNIQSEYIENGDNLFLNNKNLVSFEGNLNALTSANYMFKNCYNLTSFENDLSNLISAKDMFLNCENLSIFNGDISKLSDGTNMFIGCVLNSTSIEHILNSIPTYTAGTHNLGLSLKSSEEAAVFNQITGANVEIGDIYNISYKGWTITTYILKDDREIPTKYDIWENVISVNKETGTVDFVDLYIPDASAWKTEIYDNFKLRIRKVEDNKAYNGDIFVCNILSEKIVNGDNLFNGVSSLTSFTDNLSSLSSGVNMFNDCSLDSISVETILSTIPSYTDGEHILTMRVSGDAAEKFKEITGATDISEELSSISFKGWTIQVNKVSILSTEYDIWEGTPYIPDASAWRTNVYDEHGLNITDIRDNKIYNGDEFVCNIQCESIENIETMDSELSFIVGEAFSNTNLSNVSGDFSSLIMMLSTFANTNISNFSGNLSSVMMGLFPFSGCYKLSSFDSDLSSLVAGGMDGMSMEFFQLFMKIKGFFSNTKLSSFNKNLSSLICGGAMFTNCNKLSSFHSDISSLGNYIKIFEIPTMAGASLPAPYPPQTQEDIDAWDEWNDSQYTSAFMFMGCNLDAESVEHILYSLPSYNDGLLRILGMTINPEAATKFGEITGTTPTTNYIIAAMAIDGMGVEIVEYKGWTILVNLYNNVSSEPDYDIPEGTEIISEWPLSGAFSSAPDSIYLIDNKIVEMDLSSTDSIFCLANINLDSVWYINDFGIFSGVQNFGLDFPSLEIGNALFQGSRFYIFSSYLGNLKLDIMSFSSCENLFAFVSSLKSLSFSMGTFGNCSSLETFLSDLRSLCMAGGTFQGCSSLSSFTPKLTSLGNYEKGYSDYINTAIKIPGETETPPTLEEFITQFPGAPDMFSGCQLDAASVENILTSIPEWNDEYYRELGMTIQSGEAATKFGEITGIIPASTEIVEVPFKGWNIKVNLYSV